MKKLNRVQQVFVVMLFAAVPAFAAPPRIAVAVVNPPGIDDADAAKTSVIARLVATTISEDVSATTASAIVAKPECINEEATYQACVFSHSLLRAHRRQVGSSIPANADALLVCVFNNTRRTALFDGVYYLVGRDGDWRSSGFSLTPVPAGRLLLQASIARHAAELGLTTASGSEVGVAMPGGVTLFGDAVIDTPAALK
jgi:hypothetical protein